MNKLQLSHPLLSFLVCFSLSLFSSVCSFHLIFLFSSSKIMTPSFCYTSLHRIFLTFILLATQTFSLDTKFKACEPKSCGKGPEISFPFYLSGKQQPFCGYPSFELTCDDDQELPVLGIAGEAYLIKNMSYEKQRLHVVNSRVSHDPCPSPMHNLTLHRTPFSVIPSNINFSILYNCSGNLWEDFTTYPLTCSGSSNTSLRSFGVFQRKKTPGTEITFASGSCQKQVDVPVSASVESDVHLFLTMTYAEILKRGFAMNWTAHSCVRCNSSGGRCGTDDKEFVCLCPDGPSIHNTCRKGNQVLLHQRLIDSLAYYFFLLCFSSINNPCIILSFV